MLRPAGPQRAARGIAQVERLPGRLVDHRACLELTVLLEAIHREVIARIERHALHGHVAALPELHPQGSAVIGREADAHTVK